MRNPQCELKLIESINTKNFIEICTGVYDLQITTSNGIPIESYRIGTDWFNSDTLQKILNDDSTNTEDTDGLYYFHISYEDSTLRTYNPLYKICEVMVSGEDNLWMWDFFKPIIFNSDPDSFVAKYYDKKNTNARLVDFDIRVYETGHGYRELRVLDRKSEDICNAPTLLFSACWWSHRLPDTDPYNIVFRKK